MNPNNFQNLKWWEKLLFCNFGTKELRRYTYQSIVVIPLLLSFILNSFGIVGVTSCVIALGVLALYTIFVVVGERYFMKHFGEKSE